MSQETTSKEQMLQTIDALQARCVDLETERDRFFHMKRRNAGSYAGVRATLQKVRALVAPYMELLPPKVMDLLGAAPKPPEWLPKLLESYAVEAHNNSYIAEEEHIVMMCGKVEEFLASGQEDKANRWLGFIQGVFWSHSVYTIDELRAHMRGELP